MLLQSLLFSIPSPMKWTTDQVANIINIFSAAGTIGALLYAYHLERKNSKKINDLAVIAKELQRQNGLQSMQMKNSAYPNVGASVVMTLEPHVFLCSVLNHGTPLDVTRIINHNEKDLRLEPIEVPFQLSKHQPLLLKFSPNNPHTYLDKKCFDVEVSVSDIFNHRYMVILNGHVIKGEGPMPKIEIHEDEDEETYDSRLNF